MLFGEKLGKEYMESVWFLTIACESTTIPQNFPLKKKKKKHLKAFEYVCQLLSVKLQVEGRSWLL